MKAAPRCLHDGTQQVGGAADLVVARHPSGAAGSEATSPPSSASARREIGSDDAAAKSDTGGSVDIAVEAAKTQGEAVQLSSVEAGLSRFLLVGLGPLAQGGQRSSSARDGRRRPGRRRHSPPCRSRPPAAPPAARGHRRRSRPRAGCRCAFMASRCAVASSSDWPPERKAMPGTADGTQSFSTLTVARGHLFDASSAWRISCPARSCWASGSCLPAPRRR